MIHFAARIPADLEQEIESTEIARAAAKIHRGRRTTSATTRVLLSLGIESLRRLKVAA